jgi:hypothetical protein
MTVVEKGLSESVWMMREKVSIEADVVLIFMFSSSRPRVVVSVFRPSDSHTASKT